MDFYKPNFQIKLFFFEIEPSEINNANKSTSADK